MKKIIGIVSLLFMATATAQEAQPKKLVLWGIKGVLLHPDMSKVSGGNIGGLLGFTPEKVEQELFKALRPLRLSLSTYTGTYPMLIEGWLTGAINNWQAKGMATSYIKKTCSFVKKMRLKTAAQLAFTPNDAAIILSRNQSVTSLAQACKSRGHTIAICSSWNAQSFQALQKHHSSLFAAFNAHYISGACGILACQEQFYDQMIRNYAPENIYLVDCLPENLQAARKRGITTITASSVNNVQHELKKHGLI